MHNSSTTGSAANATDTSPSNGVPGTATTETAAEEARRKAQERAEQMVDQLGERVGHYVSTIGHSFLRWVARAREEAEDIWAEAQALRDRQRSPDKPSEGSPPGNT